MKQICSHIQSVKKEIISNKIRQLGYCDNAGQMNCKAEDEKWLCLDCGFFGCGRSSDNQCSLKHNQQQGHAVAISDNMTIWCYKCDNDLDSILEDVDEKNKNRVKIEKLADEIKQLMFAKIKQNKDKKPTQTQISINNQIVPQVFGLKNLGNTCFFNSIMQCLNGTKILQQYYLNQKEFSVIQTIQNKSDDEDDGWIETKPKQQQSQQSSRTQSLKGTSINLAFQNFLLNARRAKGSSYDPYDVFKQCASIYGRFRGMAQQDAGELLRCLLDALATGEEKLKNFQVNRASTNGKAKKTVIENIFGGYLCNYLKCLECNRVSRTFDFCLDYSIQISKPKYKQNIEPEQLYEEIQSEEIKDEKIPYFDVHEHILVQKNHLPKPSNSPYLQIKECLDSFTEYEELDMKKNYFKCEVCKKNGKTNTRALRKFYLYDLPQVVTIVLKRFQQTSQNKFQKVTEHVQLSEFLDFSDYTLLKQQGKYTVEEVVEDYKDKLKYQLYGVVVHSGGMNGGHYIAYVKHNINGKETWFYFSDSHYSQCTLKDVLGAQAYIAFYEKIE